MRERTAMGLGVKQSSDIISLANENKLFEIGELGDSNPQQLLNTVIYMVGLHFALRGEGGAPKVEKARVPFTNRICY